MNNQDIRGALWRAPTHSENPLTMPNLVPAATATQPVRVALICSALAMTLATTACGVAERQRQEEFQAQKTAALKRWKELCKTEAGEKIYRTAKDVEGIFLIKIRPYIKDAERRQYEMLSDPYGNDFTEDEYIKQFLKGYYHQGDKKWVPGDPPREGFRYVDVIDPTDRVRYRYTAELKELEPTNAASKNLRLAEKSDLAADAKQQAFVMTRTPATGPVPRYAITYDEISTQQDRKAWTAGSSLRVIDLKTQEVMAERIGYMIDENQGKDPAGRAPWVLATHNACPSFQWNPSVPAKSGAAAQWGQTLVFAEKVLHPAR